MLRAMRTAATGMKSQQLNVDNIANNLANVNTNGFKKSRVNFQDLFYQQTGTVGKAKASGIAAPAGLQIGYGANAVTTQRLFTQGELMETANPTDMAIMGDGFFRLLTPNGDSVYTRDGNFSVSGDGQLVSSSGYVLDPGIVIPEDTQEIGISEDGTVSVTVAGDPYPQILGEVELVRFVNPAGLKAQGQNVYTQTAISGEAIPGMPGTSSLGRLQQGYLEVSNVEIVEEMIALIAAQRAYEVNSKAIKAAEDMMGQANDLTR